MSLRPHRKSPKLYNRVDMSVFAGVVMTLLFIFMVNPTPFHHGVGIDLSRAQHSSPMSHAQRGDALIVAIRRDGKIFFDTSQVGPESLRDQLLEDMKTTPERTVYIRGDRRARYRAVAEVVDQVHAAGIERVGILTERKIPGP